MKLGNAKKCIPLIAVAALVLCIPLIFVNFSYGVMVCCFIEIYIIAVSGFDVLLGYSGQISMGHAAFFAIGAYGSALLNQYAGLPVLLAMVVASLISGVVGALLAYPVSKLRFSFLVLATIAFGEIVYQLIVHSPNGITGDFIGIFCNPINIFGLEFSNYTAFYYLGLVFVVLFVLAKYFLADSRVGRALQAVKQNSHAAEGMGVDVRKYKIIAFAISAVYCAFAGSMYAALVNFISPDTFTRKTSFMFLAMAMMGGGCSILGPIVGSIVMLLINEVLRYAQEYQTFVYGFVLLFTIMVIPRGIVGEVTYRIKNKKKAEDKSTAIQVDAKTTGGVEDA